MLVTKKEKNSKGGYYQEELMEKGHVDVKEGRGWRIFRRLGHSSKS